MLLLDYKKTLLSPLCLCSVFGMMSSIQEERNMNKHLEDRRPPLARLAMEMLGSL